MSKSATVRVNRNVVRRVGVSRESDTSYGDSLLAARQKQERTNESARIAAPSKDACRTTSELMEALGADVERDGDKANGGHANWRNAG